MGISILGERAPLIVLFPILASGLALLLWFQTTEDGISQQRGHGVQNNLLAKVNNILPAPRLLGDTNKVFRESPIIQVSLMFIRLREVLRSQL